MLTVQAKLEECFMLSVFYTNLHSLPWTKHVFTILNILKGRHFPNMIIKSRKNGQNEYFS